jgi:hypothetical protein
MTERQADTRHQLEVARQIMAARKDALEALAKTDAADRTMERDRETLKALAKS